MTSTAIYTCYRQLHPPTGVDHAIFGSITGPGSRNLVVGKACILELYRVHRQDERSKDSNSNGSPQSLLGDSDDTGFFLELAGSFPLAGNITALAVIPVRYEGYFSSTSRSPQHDVSGTKTATAGEALASQDILVVCFGTAQVALVAYDADLGRLTTLSIHNFDADAIGPGSGGVESGYGLASALKDRSPTISAFDPEGRCMAAVVAGYQLVVLPTLRYIPRSVFLSEENKDRVVGSYRNFRRRQQDLKGSLGSPSADAKPSKSFGESSINGSSTTANGPTSGAREAPIAKGSGEGQASGANGVGDHHAPVEAEHTETGGGPGAESGEGEKDAAGGIANGGSRVAAAHWAVSKPFTVDLEEGGVTGFVKAMVFLHGLHEPAVAVLFEPIQTCPGRLGKLRSTCRLVVMSINLIQGRSPVIWRVDDLPHDSWNLVAVPSPVGGLQVISTNAVLHIHESEVKSILAVNGYAKATVDEELLKCPLSGSNTDWGWASFRHSYSAVEVVDLSSYEICVELDSCCCAFLNPTSLLITLRGGEVYALRLHLAGGGGDAIGSPNRVVGQSMRPLGRSSPCSVLVVSASGTAVGASSSSLGNDVAEDPPEGTRKGSSSGLVFMGSRVGDSLLVKFSVTSTSAEPGARGNLSAKREPKSEDLEDVHDAENPGDEVGVAEVAVKKEDVVRSSEVDGDGAVGPDGEFVPRPDIGDAAGVDGRERGFDDRPANGDVGSAREVSTSEAVTAADDEGTDRLAKAGGGIVGERDAPNVDGAGQPGEGDEEGAGEDRSSRTGIANGAERNAPESGPMEEVREEGDRQRSQETALDGEKAPESLEMSDEDEPATRRKRLRRGDDDDRSEDDGVGDGDDEDIGGAGEISPEDSGSGFEGADGNMATRGVRKRAKISNVEVPPGVKQDEEDDEALPSVEETADASPEATLVMSFQGGVEAGGGKDDVPETSTVVLERLETGNKSRKNGRNETRGGKKWKTSDASAGEVTGEAQPVGDGTKVTESGEICAGTDSSLSSPEGLVPKVEAEDAFGLDRDGDEDGGDLVSEMPRGRTGEDEFDWDEGAKVLHDATGASEAAFVRDHEGVTRGTAAVKEEPVKSKMSLDTGADSESEMGAEIPVGRGDEGEGLAAQEASESFETQTVAETVKSSDAADAVGSTPSDVGQAEASSPSSLEEGIGVESDLLDGARDRVKRAVALSMKSEAESFAENSGFTDNPNESQSSNVPEVVEMESMEVDPTPGARDGTGRGSKRKHQAFEVPSSDKGVQEVDEDSGDIGEGAAHEESMRSDPSSAENQKGHEGDADEAPIASSPGEVADAEVTAAEMDLPDASVPDSSTAISRPSESQVTGESAPAAAAEVATDALMVSGKVLSVEDKALEESAAVPVTADTKTSPPSTSTVGRMLQQPHEVPTLDELEDAEEELLLYGRRLKAAADEGGRFADARRRSAVLPVLGPRSGEQLIDAVGFRLKVIDSLSTLGPIVDAVVVPSVYHVPRGALGSGADGAGPGGAWNGGVNKRDLGSVGGISGPTTNGSGIRTSLVCAAGFGKHGSLAVFSAGLRTEVVVDLLIPGATGAFSVAEQHGHRDTLVLVSLSPILLQAAAQDGGVEGSGHTRVLAFEADSKVIELEDGADENPFVGEAATIDACAMAGGTIIQAHSQGLRVARGRQAIQDVLASEDIELGGLGAAAGATVLGVAAAGVYACCLLSGCRLQLMALEEGDEDEADLIPAAAEGLDESVDGDDGDGDAPGDRPPGVNGSQGGAAVTAEAGVGDAGVSGWEDVEAMCMFGVKESSGDDAAPDLVGPTARDAQLRGEGRGLFVRDTEREPLQDMNGAEMREVGAAAAVAVSTAAVADLPGGTSYDSDEEEWTALYSKSGRGAILGQATKLTGSCSAMTSLGSTQTLAASGCVEGDPMETESQGTSEDGRAGGNGAGDGDGDGDDDGDGDGEVEVEVEGDKAPVNAMASDGKKGWWGGSSWSFTLPEVTAYLLVCRHGGSLEIYACRGRGREARGLLIFRTSRASLAPVTLWNELLLPDASQDRVGMPPGSAELEATSAGGSFGSPVQARRPGGSGPSDSERQQERNSITSATDETRHDQDRLPGDLSGGTGVQNGRTGRPRGGEAEGTSGEQADARGDGRVAAGGGAGGNAKESSGTENTSTVANANGRGEESATPSNPGNAGTAGDGAAAGGSGGGGGVAASAVGAGARKSSAGGAECSNDAGQNSNISCPAVTDVIVHPVGAVDGPALLRRLVLVMHLENGDLLVYEARMSSGEGLWTGGGSSCREQVVCFSKLSHDFITRKVKGVPREAALPDPSRGRALRAVRWAVGQEGVSFARPGCRSALILAERGAVCISQIAQDDLGDGAGSPPLPPGAPPSWAGIGLGSLAPVFNRRAFPGGGFAGITAGGGRLRFISAAPAASQLVNPGVSGGGGLGGGGQGHFVAAKVALGATIHSLVHLPKELVQPGKAGDILRGLLLRKGHYVALVSRMVDAIVEETLAQGGGEDEEDVDGMAGEDEEVEGPVRHIVKHKNWTVADPAFGGAPPLLVPKFELRILALATGEGLPSSGTTNAGSSSGETGGGDGDVKPSSSASGAGADGGSDARARGSGEAVDGEGKGAGPISTAEEGHGRWGREGGAQGHGTQGPDAGFEGLAGGAVSGDMLSAATVESHPLALDENGLCVCLVTLEQRGSLRMYVAIGTGMNDSQGEDKAARGRLLLFEVDYAYLAREDGSHEYAVKIRQVYAKEQLGPVAGESGPVSAIAQLGRHIILSVGKKVIVNRWEPKSCTLELIGFHDPRVYVVSLSVIKKRFVLLGDVMGSVQLVVWREEDHSLTPLSKDHEDCEVFSTEYLVDEPAMGIVVADSRRNLKVLQYAPIAPDSRGGTKLLCQSDFFLGSKVAKLTRRRTRGNLRGGARYCLLAGTLDGGLGVVLPVDERVFRRLYALQGIMSNALGHTGAANPRAFRLFDHGPAFRNQSKKNMLDGTLLWRFVGLDSRTQHDLTRAIGTTVDRVMANLLDIDLASLF